MDSVVVQGNFVPVVGLAGAHDSQRQRILLILIRISINICRQIRQTRMRINRSCTENIVAVFNDY